MSSQPEKKTPLGGRPKKADHERRIRRFEVRLTIAEQAHIRAKAKALGMSPTDYIREKSLGPLPGPKSSAVETRDEGAATQAQMASLLRELNAIGINLNQLTRNYHSGREGVHDWQQLQDDLSRVLAQVGNHFS